MAKPNVPHAAAPAASLSDNLSRAHIRGARWRGTRTDKRLGIFGWICEHAVRVSCKCLVFHFNSTFEIYYLNQTHTDIIVFYRKKV